MSDTHNKSPLALAIMQAYGAGQIKQGLVAGEYPVPKVTIDIETIEDGVPAYTYAGGTVTGRFTRKHPPFEELPKAQIPKWVAPELDAACDALLDFSKIEARVMADTAAYSQIEERVRVHTTGKVSLGGHDPAAKWAGIDKRTLSDVDRARRFSDLYGGPARKLGDFALSTVYDHWKQAMLEQGYEPEGDGAFSDTWIKKGSDK